MQEDETIADRAETWKENIDVFSNKHRLKEHDTSTAVKNGLNKIIDAAVQQSVDGWTLDDETCPVCGGDYIWDVKASVETTRHSNKEVEIVSAGNTTTPLEFECCDCETVLMTSPAAIVCPALSGELQPQKSLKNTKYDLNSTSNRDDVDVALDVISAQTTESDWKPGERPDHSEFVVETPVDAFPSKISSGVFHCDTIGERLTTLEYLSEATRKPLLQSSAALLINDFSL